MLTFALVRRQVVDTTALDAQLAGRERDEAADQVERRRLAAAGRSEQAEELARLDPERDARRARPPRRSASSHRRARWRVPRRSAVMSPRPGAATGAWARIGGCGERRALRRRLADDQAHRQDLRGAPSGRLEPMPSACLDRVPAELDGRDLHGRQPRARPGGRRDPVEPDDRQVVRYDEAPSERSASSRPSASLSS